MSVYVHGKGTSVLSRLNFDGINALLIRDHFDYVVENIDVSQPQLPLLSSTEKMSAVTRLIRLNLMPS